VINSVKRDVLSVVGPLMMGTALKIALGMVCFGIGAASLIGGIGTLLFVSASDAHIPAMFGTLGAMFLWISFLLLRRLRWHND
jgi:xanthine/uracil permease